MQLRGVNYQRYNAPWDYGSTGQTWTQSLVIELTTQGQKPFLQSDWPNPTPVLWNNHWNWRQVDKIGFDKLPIRQQDWPNPKPVLWDNHWTDTRAKNRQKPFRQQDWPNPQPVLWYNHWSQFPLEEEIGRPHNQYDWPNPKPVLWDNFLGLSLINVPFPPFKLPVVISPPQAPTVEQADSFAIWSPPGIGGRRYRVRSWAG